MADRNTRATSARKGTVSGTARRMSKAESDAKIDALQEIANEAISHAERAPLPLQLLGLAYGGGKGMMTDSDGGGPEHIPGITDGLTIEEVSRLLALRGTSSYNHGRRKGTEETRQAWAARAERERPLIVAGALEAVLGSLTPVLEGMAAKDIKTRTAARGQLVALSGEIAASARKMREQTL